jgi:hypothetical protein
MTDIRLRLSLFDHPKIAEEIGELNVAWAAVEFRMFIIFFLLSGTSVQIARAIFYSLRTTRARIELVLAVAPLVLRKRRGTGTISDFKKLSTLLGQIGNLAGERNKYVHDPWGFLTNLGRPGAYQFRLGGKEIHGQYSRIHRRELSALSKKLRTKSRALRRFAHLIGLKLPALLEKLSRQQDLTLALAKKDIRPKKTQAKPRRQPRSSGP